MYESQSIARVKECLTDQQQKHYAPGSPDRKALEDALATVKSKAPLNIPLTIAGKDIKSSQVLMQSSPSTHSPIASYSNASAADVEAAINAALAARESWASASFADRASVFLKAADLISSKYRYEIMALTMHGQGKNAWQAEIDAAAELCDFFRFGVKYAEELYAQQPAHNSAGVWK